MNKLKECTLVFIEEIKNENDIEHLKNKIKIRIGNVSNTKYYSNLNNSREIACVGFLAQDVLISQHQLRFLIIDNVRYKVERYSETTGKRYILDLSEVK